ncbi:MAG: copper chaperone PCu(A)C [Pseudomonadota bacterium]|nr:copper chaperone PCu(A)C [Pseudomonadota bacterium]
MRSLTERAFAFCCALALSSAALCAHEYRTDSLRIDHPFARATPPGAKIGGVFFTVYNFGNQTDRLVRASTPIAAGVVLHQMAFDGGVMKMRAVPSVEVRPGGRLELKPDGYHLMLVDLKQPLKVGEKFPLTLTFERAGGVLISVPVEDMGAMPPQRR